MAEKVTKNRYDNLDGLRTISCFGIIAMHIKANSAYHITGWIYDSFVSSFTLLVFLFLMISSFAMCCGYYEKIKNGSITPNLFFQKRYKKILPFFLFLILIDLVLDFSFEHLAEGLMESTMLFGLLPYNELSVIGVGWTLGVIFLFYIMFPYFVFLFDNKKRGIISFTISILLCVLCNSYFFSDKFVVESFTPRHNILYCLPYFGSGCLIYLYREEIKQRLGNHKLLSLAICILCTAAYYLFMFPNSTVFPLELLLYIPWLIYAIGFDSRILDNRIVRYFSSISLECYLSHMVIFRLLEKLHILYLFGDGIISYVLTLVLVIVGLIVFIEVWKRITNLLSKQFANRKEYFNE